MTRLNDLKTWLLVALVALLAIGCGGSERGGTGTGESTVPETFMTALSNAVATRDVDFIGINVSPLFLDDCADKNAFMNEVMSMLGTSGTITFTITPPTSKNVDDLRGKASFTGGFELKVVDGETTRTMTRNGTFDLRAESGRWKLYGNQKCGP